MNKLFNYNDYILDIIFEAIDESLPLFISDKLRKLLTSIDNDIAFDIISNTDQVDKTYNVTFLDIDDTNKDKKDVVHFMQSNKAINKSAIAIGDKIDRRDNISDDDLKKYKKNIYVTRGRLFDKNNPSTTIGKIVKKLFPNKYGVQQIEEFVNLYKAKREDKSDINFEIVKGNDIQYWYDEINYVKGGGSLNKSCMRYSYKRNYMKFYAINPDKISLIILKSGDKIKGRAILWKLDDPSDRMFMDRIYTVNDADVNLFKDYATENNFIYKVSQNMNSNGPFFDPLIDREDSFEFVIDDINDPGDGGYPYMDTLKYFKDNRLTNDDDSDYGTKILEDTDGNYDDFGVWSEYESSNIDLNDAVEVYTDAEQSETDWRIDDGSSYWTWENEYGDYIYFSEDVSDHDVAVANGYNWSEYEEKYISPVDSVEVYTNADKSESDWRTDDGANYWTWEGDDEQYSDGVSEYDVAVENGWIWSEYEDKYLDPDDSVFVYTSADKNNTDLRSDDSSYWEWDEDDGDMDYYSDDVNIDEVREENGWNYSNYEETYLNPVDSVEVYTNAKQSETDWRTDDESSYWIWEDDNENYCNDVTKKELEEINNE